MDLINSSELSPVNDDVDLDAIDFQVLPWLINRGESNNNQDPRERKLNQNDICDKNLSENSGIKKHQRIYGVYNDEKYHECEYCSKRFKAEWHLVRHRRIHTGEKPFTCEFCGKTFTDITNLKRHRRIHTGERPYGCNLCEKRFSQPNNLRSHIKNRH